jgi:C4-dicarboxylate-specific signal transduction histidine kinase
VTTLVDASGRPEAIATTERDVTPIKEAEETIRVQQAEIARMGRIRAMGEFAAAMAHELNQPLCAIGVNARAAQRLIEAGEPIDEVREALGDILQDVERAGHVIQGLRDHLRKREPEHGTLDINAVVGGIARIAETLGRCESTSVRFNLGDGLSPVQGDRIQLQQVVLNLIRNGVEAMLDTAPDLRIVVVETTKSNDDHVRVSVEDHGRGLRDSVAEHMFEPFYTTKPHGMGMGLAICRSIIEAHGGRLWATRNADAGCTLHLSLPCSRKATVA